MRLTRALLITGLLCLGLTLSTTDAAAYPQFQLSTGNDRCSACHVSPAGGGLLNEFGRDEAGSTISRGGDGRFLNGLWTPPSWLGLGADVRLAGLTKRSSLRPATPGFVDGENGAQIGGEGTSQSELTVFPMQIDLYGRVVTHGLSVNVTVGARSTVREGNGDDSLANHLASREHYVMYERGDLYARVGRFQPVFGLRSQDHTAYVRRYLGQNTLEEPYAVAVGKQAARWEAHASVFVPSPASLGIARSRGAALYAEHRVLDDTAAIGAQARVAQVEGERLTYTVGMVGKRYLPEADLMILAELNVVRERFRAPLPDRNQLAWYLGASRMLTEGVMLGGALQRFDPDVSLRGNSRDAAELNLQYFPRAHFELHLLGRAEIIGGDADHPSFLALLQAHYYL